MQGMKVGHLYQAEMRAKLKLQEPPPIICPGCFRPMHVDSFVVARPDEAHCESCKGPDGKPLRWSDFASYAPACASCGYSADHREGLGCRLEE